MCHQFFMNVSALLTITLYRMCGRQCCILTLLGPAALLAAWLMKIVPIRSTPHSFGPTFSILVFTRRPHSDVFGSFNP